MTELARLHPDDLGPRDNRTTAPPSSSWASSPPPTQRRRARPSLHISLPPHRRRSKPCDGRREARFGGPADRLAPRLPKQVRDLRKPDKLRDTLGGHYGYN